MDENPIILEVTLTYKDKHSALRLDLSEYKNKDFYLELIKDHVNIAKTIIDKQTLDI